MIKLYCYLKLITYKNIFYDRYYMLEEEFLVDKIILYTMFLSLIEKEDLYFILKKFKRLLV
jgi:hypothetical protein